MWFKPFSNTDTAWKNFHFVLSDRSDFHMIDSLSIAVHTFYYLYTDIPFSTWDIATQVCELV